MPSGRTLNLLVRAAVVVCPAFAGCSSSSGGGNAGFDGGGARAEGGATADAAGKGEGGGGASSSGGSSGGSSGSGSSSGAGTANYSCEVKSPALHVCTVYIAPTPALLTQWQANCASLKGTSGTACPSPNAIGSCTAVDGSGIETWYADGTTTAAQAEASCNQSNGTWVPG